MQLGHLLTRSGLTYPEVSSKVYHDSFCQSDSSVSLPWVIYFEAFYRVAQKERMFFQIIVTLFIFNSFIHLVLQRSTEVDIELVRYKQYTECPRRNVPDFGRVFLMLEYTDITQNTYVQS